MSIRERYHAEFGISQHEAVDKPLIEMTGYIKWLEADYAELEKQYQNDPATIQLLECTDRCIELEKQRGELDIKVEKLEKHRDELLEVKE